MASEDDDSRDLSEGTHEPRECMACRGTGRVISQLGGSPSAVSCPWCEGSGLRPAEIDAQAHWGAEGESAAGGERQASAAQPGDPGDGRAEDGAAGDADPMAGSAADPPAAGGEASEGAAASSDEEGPGAA